MKSKILKLTGIASLMLFVGSVYAQRPYDSNLETNVIRYDSPEDDITIRAGGRVAMDGAHYINDKMDMSSGVVITEARLNLFASFGQKYDLKIDVDFGRGDVTFRDIFARWNISPTSSWRVGHYVMPFSLDRTASSVDRYFVATSGTVSSLTLDRRIGTSFRNFGKAAWFEVGAYTGNAYGKQKGDAGWGLTGRVVFNPQISDNTVLHVGGGLSYRTPDPNGFTDGDDDYNRYIRYGAGAETNVDDTRLIDADIEYARNEFRYNAEVLLVSGKFMVQSEFTGTTVARKRDNQRLFEDQLGGMWSFQTLEEWEAWYGKNLRSVSFKGVYVQAGYLICGSKYRYDRFQAASLPCKEKGALEVVARYNHTNLNDVDGIWYAGQFYDPSKGPGVDDPNFNYSVGGGRMNSYTLGLNYYFNKYARLMLNYGYQHVNSYTLEDRYCHTLQTRLQISF